MSFIHSHGPGFFDLSNRCGIYEHNEYDMVLLYSVLCMYESGTGTLPYGSLPRTLGVISYFLFLIFKLFLHLLAVETIKLLS